MKRKISWMLVVVFLCSALFASGSIKLGLWSETNALATLTAEEKFNKTAVFDVTENVTHTDPGDWSVTYSNSVASSSELNSRIDGGGMEPILFQNKYVPSGDSPNEIISNSTVISSYDSYMEGMLDGADVRVYRPVNGVMQLVRTDTIDKFYCSGAFDVFGKIVVGTTANSFWDPWEHKGMPYYFAVTAIDNKGNESAKSNWDSATFTAAPSVNPSPTSLPANNFLAVNPSPSAAPTPAAPVNFTATESDSTKVIFNWNASSDPNVVGYKVYKSYFAPENQHGFRLMLSQSLPENPVKKDDMVFVRKKFYSWSRIANLSPRIFDATAGNQTKTLIPFFPDEYANKTYQFVPHGSTPPDFTDKGETCAMIDLKDASAQFNSAIYSISGVSATGGDWYHIMRPGQTYTMQAWMKKDGAQTTTAEFSLTGYYSSRIPKKTFTLTNEWQKYTYDFLVPEGISTSTGVDQFVLKVQGPVKFYIDNYEIYNKAVAFADWMPDAKQLLMDSGFKVLRNHTFIKSGNFNHDMNMLLNPPGAFNGTAGGGSTLYNQFKLCKDTNTLPWLQIEMSMNEKEWKDLVEYISAPYNPAIDTPASKPSAYKRYISGQTAPWSDEFATIYFEISNETWNGMFAPWTFPATTDQTTGATYSSGNTYGLFQEYVLKTMGESPYWNALKDKIYPVAGGWAVNKYEMGEGVKSPNTKALYRADYNGGWDEGTILDATDGGYFYTALYGIQKADPDAKAFLAARNAVGLTQPLGSYEAGPGYSLPGSATTPEQKLLVEKNNDMQKSMVGAVSTLDSFLVRAAYYEYDMQNFFTFNSNRNYWTSHAWNVPGVPRMSGQTYPAFDALTLYTKYARGDFLNVKTVDGPTYDIPPIGTRVASLDSPMVGAYATRNGDDYTVFVLNRKVDNYPFSSNAGYAKAEFNLPFTNCESVTLRKMEGKWDGTKYNPRISNIEAQNVAIQTETIPLANFSQHFVVNENTGAHADGMVPCGVYMYTFHNVSKQAPEAPVIQSITGVNVGARIANRITWSASPTATYYNVYVSQTQGNPVPNLNSFSLIGTVTGGNTTFDDVTSNSGTGYYYYVRAINAIGYYEDSHVVFAPPSGGFYPIGTTAPMATPIITPTPVPTPMPPILFAYDGFDYTPGFAVGLNGGYNWNGGWVSNAAPTPPINVETASPMPNKGVANTGNYLTGYSNYSYFGRKLMANSTTSLDIKKFLNESFKFGKAGTTIWMSSLMRTDKVDLDYFLGLHNDSVGWWLNDGNTTYYNISFGGYGASSKKADNKYYWTLKVGPTGYALSNKEIVVGETVFVAVKIDFTENGGLVKMYLNPTPLTDPTLSAPDAQVEITTKAFQFSGISFYKGSGSKVAIDEVRIGNLFDAVAPKYYVGGVTPSPTPTPTPTPLPTARPTPAVPLMAPPTPSPTPTSTPTPTPTPTPSPTPTMPPVVASDNTIVVNAAPAGMKTTIQDNGNGYITVLCKLKGVMNINSFSWAIGYDKTKVVPVTFADPKTDAPNAKLATAAAIAPYFEVPGASQLTGYNLASFQIENTSAVTSGNYVLIGYTKYTGATLSLSAATEAPMLKMTFRKISAIDDATFSYFHKAVAGTVVSKLIYSTTNVLQYPVTTGATVYTRPDLFALELVANTKMIRFRSLTAIDPMNSGDAVYDAYIMANGTTHITLKQTYMSNEILYTTTVDPVTKMAQIPVVADGKYFVSVSRNGWLTRNFDVAVAGATVELGDKSLIPGDVYLDGIIDGSDSEALFASIGMGYGDAGYLVENDINLDGILDGTDTETIFANIGLDEGTYGEYYII